jgi:hypothetical protein
MGQGAGHYTSFRGKNQNLLGSHIEPLADSEDMRIMTTFSSNVRIATALAVAVLSAAFPAASAQAADTT